MESNILLSYILPCYNTGKYVKECIESLYRQNMNVGSFEVIVVNNATLDDTEEIVYSLMDIYKNVVYVKLDENICSGGAYNSGLKVARGKYIQFVDSDDFLKDSVMGELVDKMEKGNLEMLYHNIDSFCDVRTLTHEDNLDYNGNILKPISRTTGYGFMHQVLEQLDFNKMPVPAYRKLILKDFLLNNKLFFTPTTIGCDYLHNAQCLLFANRVALIPKSIYMFRYNPNGVTKSKLNSAKIIFGLNNYSLAYNFVNRVCKDEIIKKCYQENLISLINAYIGAMKYLDWQSKKQVYSKVVDFNLLKELSKGVLNRMIISTPVINKFLPTHMLFNAIHLIRR